MRTTLAERRVAARRFRAHKYEGDVGWGYKLTKLYGKENLQLLSIEEVCASPQFGCGAVVVAEQRRDLNDTGLVRAFRDLASDYADLSGFERTPLDDFGSDGSLTHFTDLTMTVAGRVQIATVFEDSVTKEMEEYAANPNNTE